MKAMVVRMANYRHGAVLISTNPSPTGAIVGGMDGNDQANGRAGRPQADARRRRTRMVVAVIALTLLAFGAGALVAVLAADDQPAVAQSAIASLTGGATGSPSASNGSQGPSSSADPTAQPTSVGDVLPDGRHFVQVEQVVDLGGGRAVRVDLAYFLVDEAAEEAAADHGDEVFNGYYIVNDNPKLRTVPIASDAKVTYISMARCCDSVKGDLDAWADSMNGTVPSDYPPADSTWWWFTVHAGRVTAIDQQYLP